jgi:hypothetical protein
VASFLAAWTDSSATADDDPDRATVYRWMQGTLPKNEDLLIRLSVLLDVDPFALLTIVDQDVETALDQMLEIVQRSSSKPAPLQLLRNFLGRQKEWPPEALAKRHFECCWHIQEFEHDPAVRSNFYAAVELTCDRIVSNRRPQLFHFAYRSPRFFAGRWLQYGIVACRGRAIDLWHINGHAERIEADIHEPARVKTWFGPGSITFRVASLHPFLLTRGSDEDDKSPAVVFPG